MKCCHLLSKKGIAFQRQVYLPVVFDGLSFDEGLRLDVFVENFNVPVMKNGIRRFCRSDPESETDF